MTAQQAPAFSEVTFPPPKVVWGEWRANGANFEAAPTDHLIAVVYINGIMHYAEAIAMVPQEPGDTAPQRAVDGMQETFEAICAASGIGGRFLTMKIGERDYMLLITPGTRA